MRVDMNEVIAILDSPVSLGDGVRNTVLVEVKDAGGAAVPNALVTLSSDVDGAPVSTRRLSDVVGAVWFNPPMDSQGTLRPFSVRASAPGYVDGSASTTETGQRLLIVVLQKRATAGVEGAALLGDGEPRNSVLVEVKDAGGAYIRKALVTLSSDVDGTPVSTQRLSDAAGIVWFNPPMDARGTVRPFSVQVSAPGYVDGSASTTETGQRTLTVVLQKRAVSGVGEAMIVGAVDEDGNMHASFLRSIDLPNVFAPWVLLYHRLFFRNEDHAVRSVGDRWSELFAWGIDTKAPEASDAIVRWMKFVDERTGILSNPPTKFEIALLDGDLNTVRKMALAKGFKGGESREKWLRSNVDDSLPPVVREV